MKILYISPSLPNDFSRIRTKNIINSLINDGNSVSLVSLTTEKDYKSRDKNLLKKLNDVKIFKQSKLTSILNCFLNLFFPISLQEAYVNNRKLHKYLKKCNKEYDLIYVKRLRMAQYAKYFDDKKVIIDLTDSLTKYYERVSKKVNGLKKILNLEEYFKHKISEKRVINKYKSVVCSSEEKKYLTNKLGCNANNIYVVENLIDFDLWDVPFSIKKVKEKNKLVFSGMMDYDPNIIAVNYFAKNVLNKLDSKYELYVIGKNKSKELISNKKIKYIGYVESMRDELSKYDIYVCPIIAGSGVKNKILQAMSVGLPIVSTKLGVEGLDNECKKYIYVVNEDFDFLNAIDKINNLSDFEFEKLINGQKNYIQKNYDISVAVKKIRGIME